MEPGMKKNLLLFLLSVLCLILAAQEPASTNELLVGGDSDYPPYEFLNKSGKPDGYNVELSREIFRILGKEPIFRLGKWSLVTQWLQNSEVDVLQGMAFSMENLTAFPAPTSSPGGQSLCGMMILFTVKQISLIRKS
jgi:ABC-type amino acid transport substrate-binding protein